MRPLLLIILLAMLSYITVFANDQCSVTMKERKTKGYWGHRGGCEHKEYEDIQENTIECLKVGLVGPKGDGINALQEDVDKFRFLEFDVREASKGQLVVYHGGRDGRVFMGDNATVPFEGDNKDICKPFFHDEKKCFKKLRVRNVSADSLEKINLGDRAQQHIPKLKEYIDKLNAYSKIARNKGYEARVIVEIKDVSCEMNELNSTPAKILVDSIAEHERSRSPKKRNTDDTKFKNQQVAFWVYNGQPKRLGGEKDYKCWCKALKGTKLRIYSTSKHIMKNVMNACN